MAQVTEDALIWQFMAPYHGTTRTTYLRQLMQWWALCLKGGYGLLDVTPAMIESWSAGQLTRGAAKRTVNSHLTPIVEFYRWAFREGHTTRDIGSAVRRPKSPRRSNLKWLSADQLNDFLDAAEQTSPLAHSLTCLWALNGLRLDETLTSRIEHIENVAGHTVIWLPHRKLEQSDRLGLPDRTINAIATLTGTRKRGLIHHTGGKKLRGDQIYKLLDRVSEIAGIDFHVRPHQLRATFITLALEAGVSVVDVMNSAGHSSLSMVTYYDRGYRSVTRNASIPLTNWLNTLRRDSIDLSLIHI